MTILWVETISLISDIASFCTVPIYIIIIYILVKYRNDDHLKSSFFTLIISIGVADISRVIFLFFGNKLAGYGWVAEVYMAIGPLASRLNAIFGFFFGAAQAIGVFLIACNRFTAYVFPMKHRMIWQGGKVLWMLITLKWLLSFASIYLMISHYQYKFNYQVENNRSIILAWNSAADADAVNYYNNLGLKGSLVTVSFILYIVVFVTALARKIKYGSLITAERAALCMSVVGFVHCIGIVIYLIAIMILVCGLVGCDWEGHSPYCVDSSVYYLISNLGANLCASVTPYALLLFSSPVRTRFFDLFNSSCCCKVGFADSGCWARLSTDIAPTVI